MVVNQVQAVKIRLINKRNILGSYKLNEILRCQGYFLKIAPGTRLGCGDYLNILVAHDTFMSHVRLLTYLRC